MANRHTLYPGTATRHEREFLKPQNTHLVFFNLKNSFPRSTSARDRPQFAVIQVWLQPANSPLKDAPLTTVLLVQIVSTRSLAAEN